MVISGSVLIVYLASSLYGIEYTHFLLFISVVLPLLLTPVALLIMLKIITRLQDLKKTLELEIEKNKEKDLILFEQARFVLMGEMIENISHQWKQPLNTINLALLDMKMTNIGKGLGDKHFDIIESNVNYMAETIDNFMSFLDKRSSSKLKTLKEMIKEIETIIGGQFSNEKIELEIVIDESYSKVEISSSLSQVILNLLNNAKDALNEKENKKIRLEFLTNDYGLELECCDNGSGIAEDVKDKIFHPYFTTKTKTQGTGIGLYMSKEIILKIFDGNIAVRNTNKTCFFIAIPYSESCIKIGDK
jgi:signal transduction histidine kinase